VIDVIQSSVGGVINPLVSLRDVEGVISKVVSVVGKWLICVWNANIPLARVVRDASVGRRLNDPRFLKLMMLALFQFLSVSIQTLYIRLENFEVLEYLDKSTKALSAELY
jgi:hypothetical protein